MSAEQRTNMKFLVQLGKTPSEALGMLQKVYGDDTMSRSRVFVWCKRFKEGREDVEDDPRSGRPSTSRNEANVERVKQMVRGDRRLTVRQIADELGMNHNSVWKIITEDLGMQKVCAKMVPRRAREEAGVVAGQLVAASPRYCTCSQCPEHQRVLGQEEHRRAGATSLLT